MKTAAIIGDSQGGGLASPLSARLEARGYSVVSTKTEVGISTAAAIEAGFFAIPDVDLLIVILGGNDTGTTSYRATLGHALALASPHARKIVWVGPMQSADAGVDARHQGVTDRQRETMAILRTTWINGRPLSAGLEHSPDGTHFTHPAYVELAKRIDSAIFFPTYARVLLGAAAALAGAGATYVVLGLAR